MDRFAYPCQNRKEADAEPLWAKRLVCPCSIPDASVAEPPSASASAPFVYHDPRARGAAMIEALLVLPIIFFMLSLTIYFGLSMQRYQRAMMADRYEVYRGSARAPGPRAAPVSGVDDSLSLPDESLNVRTDQLGALFFDGDGSDLSATLADYFPLEPREDLQQAAATIDPDAGRLLKNYYVNFPRGRSLRLRIEDRSGVALWDRLFPGALRHRHTRMDTDWRFFNHVIEANEWYDDRVDRWRILYEPGRDPTSTSLPSLSPGTAVRETFYADLDRRIDPLAVSNPLAQRVQTFSTLYPLYHGPEVPVDFIPGRGWAR